MATFKQLYEEAQSRSGNNTAATLTSIKRWINFRQQEICSYGWEWQLKHDAFNTVAPYTTGTVSGTVSTNILSFSGSTITSTMTGRKIKFTGYDNVYRITYSSSSAATTDTDLVETIPAGTAFTIFKDEYTMPYDCLGLYALGIKGDILEKEATIPAIRDDSAPSDTGNPEKYSVIGIDRDAYYSTGTISVSTKTIALTSGTFPSDIAGMWIRSDTQGIAFQISTRDGDSAATLKRSGMVASGSTYQIEPGPKQIIRLTPVPDAIYRVDRWYFAKTPDMVNDNDISELPDNMHKVLQDGVYLSFLEHQREFTPALSLAQAEYNNGIYRARVEEDILKARGRTPRIRTGYDKDTTGSWA